MSINWHLDVEPAPAILVLPPAAASLDEAHAAIEQWEFYKRRTLDPAQRLAVEVMMATGPDDLWAAKTTGREVSRQNGKGDEVEVVESWGLTQRAERILHTIHDAVLLATETQSRMLGLLEGHPDLSRKIKRTWRGTGQQMIEMRNGGMIWYRTRTGGAARGVDEVDRIVVDEAQHAELEHIAAITPTQLASANPQLNALGTGAIAGKSQWWWKQRLRALRGGGGTAFGYIGHTAEAISLDAEGRIVRGDIDVTDRRLWRKANPALVAGRGGGEGYFEEQYELLGPALFAREHLGVWDPEPEKLDGEVPLTLPVWGAGALQADTLPALRSEMTGRLTVGIGVALNGASSALSTQARLTRGAIFAQALQVAAGAGWVADALDAFLGAAGPRVAAVAIPGAGPAVAILDDVRQVCERRKVTLEVYTGKPYYGACEALVRDVGDGRLVHAGQSWLAAAVGGAQKRTVGASWEWDLWPRVADVSPLVAITVGRAALAALPIEQKLAEVHSF